MLVHITGVNGKPSTRKDGTPVLSKSGKQLFSVGIKTAEHGDTWINGLMPFNPDRWEGTEQEIEVYEEEYNGKTYKKFKLPQQKPTYAKPQAPVVDITVHQKLDKIIDHLSGVRPLNLTSAGTKVPDFSEVDSPEW